MFEQRRPRAGILYMLVSSVTSFVTKHIIMKRKLRELVRSFWNHHQTSKLLHSHNITWIGAEIVTDFYDWISR